MLNTIKTPESRKLFRILLAPSWLSGLVAVVIGLTISAGTILVFEVHNSSLQEQLVLWQQSKPQPALTTPEDILEEPDPPSLQSSWTLLLLWSVVGVVVYIIAAAIVHSITRAEELRESLHYVHARPRSILLSTAAGLLLRLSAAVILVIFTIRVWKQIIPYCITAAHASAVDVLSPDGIFYALLSFTLMTLSVYILTILLRLSQGKLRLFP